MSNLDYWASRPGEDYRLQQDARRSASNEAYAIEEAWLTEFVKSLHAKRPDRPIRVLDYGCGFGRFARLLTEFDFVDYFGFDLSASMTAPLRTAPPARLKENLDGHLRVGPQFEAVFPPDETFDLIFTVSVLIHNRPDAARAMVGSMLDRLAPGGQLILIENMLTAFSALQNLWHGGCWCHAFPRYVDGRADVEIVDRFAEHHGLYIISATDGQRASRFEYHTQPGVPGEPLDLAGILLKGLERAETNAESMLAEWSAVALGGSETIGRLHDLEERFVRREAELSHALAEAEQARIRIQAELSQALAQEEVARAASKAMFSERQRMLEDLACAVNQNNPKAQNRLHSADSAHGPPNGSDERPEFEWNALQDTRYSHSIPELEHTLHIFHQEWFGIRAAAGSLPGDKVAVRSGAGISTEAILDFLKAIEEQNYKRIVVHGYSKNASLIIRLLAKRGLSDKLYVVKHGNPAQWHHEPEREAAYDVFELAKFGGVKKIHFMKGGFDLPLQNLYRPVLFNFSPVIKHPKSGIEEHPSDAGRIIFAPGWADWRKNLHTSVIAASMSDMVNRIWVYAQNLVVPDFSEEKLLRMTYLGREQTFDLISMSTLCMNVSLLDCHPMVNIEAQTLGRACLRGPLHLDALEDHPYVRLTSVDNVTSMVEIKSVIDRVLSAPSREVSELALDYQARSDQVARERYLEFLEL